MSYPSAPDFTSSGPDAFNPPAWWTYTRDDGSLNVCESTGAAVVRQARSALGLSSDPTWDDNLQAALIVRAQAYDRAQPGVGWQSLVSDLQSGLSQQQVTINALKFALWIGYYQQSGLRLDAIGIPSTAALPAYGSRLPEGPNGNAMTCFDPQRDPNPRQLSSQQDLIDAQNQSSYGIRLHSGESMPAPSAPVPPGPPGLSTPMVVGIGVIVAAAVVTVVAMNRSYATSRKNPSESQQEEMRSLREKAAKIRRKQKSIERRMEQRRELPGDREKWWQLEEQAKQIELYESSLWEFSK